MQMNSFRVPALAVAVILTAAQSAVAQAPLRVGQTTQSQAKSTPQPAPAPAAQTPPPPQPTRTEILNFDSWNVTCRDFAEAKHKHVCFAQLQIVQQSNNQVVFYWTMGFYDENHQLMTLQTPTGVSITPGVDLKLAKGNRTVPYTACETGHCIATLPVDAALVRDLTATTDAKAVIHASDGRDVEVNIPLKGFDKAYAALTK
jgi:invasion protein IalB